MGRKTFRKTTLAAVYVVAALTVLLCLGGIAPAVAQDTGGGFQQAATTSWYFAEGYTGGGFKEFITIGYFDAVPNKATILYSGNVGVFKTQELTLQPNSRTTVYVNGEVGFGRDVSVVVKAPPYCVVERPIYFQYRAANIPETVVGGHNSIGVRVPDRAWYFAEGYTGAGTFDTYYCIFNTNYQPIFVRLDLLDTNGKTTTRNILVPATARSTVLVNAVVGLNKEVSAKLTADHPFVVERAAYFSYNGVQKGGTATVGAQTMGNTWYFAAGNTATSSGGLDREGADEYLCIGNPTAKRIAIRIEGYYPNEAPIYHTWDLTDKLGIGNVVEPYSRFTVPIHLLVGRNKEVSLRVTTVGGEPFIAERGLYFTHYVYPARAWVTGGEMTMGATCTNGDMRFAEGYTGGGFEEWLVLFNPHKTDSKIQVTFFLVGRSPVVFFWTVPAERNSRILVNKVLGDSVENSIRVQTTNNVPVMVERVQYFRTNLSGDSYYDGGTINMPVMLQGA